MTEWKWIVGFEGKYRISDAGEVYNISNAKYTKGTIHKHSGYLHVCLSMQDKQYTKFVHREVAKTFIGPRPAKMHVRHLDGDKLNNSVENLRYGTAQENVDDRRQEGYKGVPLSEVKFEELPTHIKRQKVYDLVTKGAGVKLIAEFYDTSYQAVVALVKRHYGGVRQLRKRYPLNKQLTVEDLHRMVA